METFPYFLILSAIIGFSVLMFGIKTVSDVDETRNFILVQSEVKQINNKIDILSSMSYGSFDYVDFTIPSNKVIIYKNGTVEYGGRHFKVEKRFSCLKNNKEYCVDKLVLESGRYRILLYHGDNFEAKYCICFT